MGSGWAAERKTLGDLVQRPSSLESSGKVHETVDKSTCTATNMQVPHEVLLLLLYTRLAAASLLQSFLSCVSKGKQAELTVAVSAAAVI